MRKLRVVFDVGCGVYVHANVIADHPLAAEIIATRGIEKRFPQWKGVLDKVPRRFYDAVDAPADAFFMDGDFIRVNPTL